MKDRKTNYFICVSCQGLLSKKITEGVKMEEGENSDEFTILIDGKTHHIKIVDKQFELIVG